jgi:archaemetzincin
MLKLINEIVSVAFLLTLSSCGENKQKIVMIQPYENFPPETVDEIKKTIETNYPFKVFINKAKKLPKSAFVNIKSPRYRADIILAIQKRSKPDSVDFVLGLTSKDISTTKYGKHNKPLKPLSKYYDWGVFGLGYRPGPSAVASTFRLTPSNQKRMLTRLKKVCVHELGHNLGLPHCTFSKECVLRDAAESIKTVDYVSENICSTCKSKIKSKYKFE